MYDAIAIAGTPNSGKTTLVQKLIELLGWQSISIGGLVRREHRKYLLEFPDKKISLPQFFENRELVTDKLLRKLNDEARSRLRQGGIILDSRYAAVNALGLTNVLLVYLDAPIQTRVQRVAISNTYNTTNHDEIKGIILGRQRAEVQRGKELFEDFVYTELRHYQKGIILDSSKLSVQEEADIIHQTLRGSA